MGKSVHIGQFIYECLIIFTIYHIYIHLRFKLPQWFLMKLYYFHDTEANHIIILTKSSPSVLCIEFMQ